MRVHCLANSGSALATSYLELGFSAQSRFDVIVGKEYLVFGLVLWKSVLLVLVSDETSLPNWYPIEAFKVVDRKLPAEWFFRTEAAGTHHVQAIWGYEELVMGESHYDDLLERDPAALAIFRARQVAAARDHKSDRE